MWFADRVDPVVFHFSEESICTSIPWFLKELFESNVISPEIGNPVLTSMSIVPVCIAEKMLSASGFASITTITSTMATSLLISFKVNFGL